MKTGILRFMVVVSSSVATAGCGDGSPFDDQDGNTLCSVNPDLLFSSLPPDAIPALTLPDMVSANSDDAQYLFDFDRVLGVVVNGEARADPHNILWHHEIVNDRIGDTWISATFCPLTGSGLVFDPFVDGKRLELGVSGLLFANNLVLFDRISGDVYGPQLSVEGKCSSFRDGSVGLRSVQEMSWGRWKEMYPNTKVVGGSTGFGRNYRRYPYGSYDNIASNELLFTMGVDRSRQIKERVLAIRISDGGRGYPFLELEKLGATSVVNEVVGGIPTVVFYESRDGQTAVAFDARMQGQTLTFSASGPSTWIDTQTGSTWTLDGTAITGPMAGVSACARVRTPTCSSGSRGDISSPMGTPSSDNPTDRSSAVRGPATTPQLRISMRDRLPGLG